MIPIKDALQAVFDKATAALIAQGRQSFSTGPQGNSICLYRERVVDSTEDMTYRTVAKCAIGHLMSDEQMERYEVVEDTNPSTFPTALLEELVPGIDNNRRVDFLLDLQQVHDRANRSDFVASFVRAANDIAVKWRLTPISIVE